jgi:hypothetical protein
MTTSAGIAPGTNSFSVSPGERGRFSSRGTTSDSTGGVLSPPDDDSTSSQDSGSSEGSAFHSVLHQFYSSQKDAGSDSTSDTAGGDGKNSDDASGSSVAVATLPLIHAGTQFRSTVSTLRTLISSSSATSVSGTSVSGTSVQTLAGKNPKRANTTASDTGKRLPAETATAAAAPLPASTFTATVLSTPTPPPEDKQSIETPDATATTPAADVQKNFEKPLTQDGTAVRDTVSFLRTPGSSTSGTGVQAVADTNQQLSSAATGTTVTPLPATAVSAPSGPIPAASGDSSKVLSPKDGSSSDAALVVPAKDNQTGNERTAARTALPAAEIPSQDRPAIQPRTQKETSPSTAAKPLEQDTTVDAKAPSVQRDAIRVAEKDVPQVVPSGTVNVETVSGTNNRPVLAHARTRSAVAPTEVSSIRTGDESTTTQGSTIPTNSPTASAESSPVDESNFSSVLNQVVSQPDATDAAQSPDSGEIRQTLDPPVVNPVALPPPRIAKTRGTSIPSFASPTTQSEPPPATDANGTRGMAAPVEQVDAAALAGSVSGTKPSESSQARMNVALPPIETSTNSTGAATSGELAFAARLTPVENNSENAAAPDGAESKTRTPEKPTGESDQVSTDAATATDRTHAGPVSDPLVKADVNLSAQPAAAPGRPETTATTTTSRSEAAPAQSNSSPAARMEQVIEAPAAPQTSGRDITVRVPDSTERGTDVRFLERGGEVHVSVRTSDTEMAQTLRGGLGDLVGRMEHTGIRTEVWKPGQDATPSQSDSRQQSFEQRGEEKGDSRGSGSGKNPQGSDEREDRRQQAEKPGWVEELETSLAQTGSQVNQ